MPSKPAKPKKAPPLVPRLTPEQRRLYAERLRAARVAAGFQTQAEAERATKIHRQQLCDYERGRRVPTFAVLDLMISGGYDPTVLFPGKKVRSRKSSSRSDQNTVSGPSDPLLTCPVPPSQVSD